MSFEKGLWIGVLGVCILGTLVVLLLQYAHPADLTRPEPVPVDREVVSREFGVWMGERRSDSWPEVDLNAAGGEPGAAWERMRDRQEVQWYYGGLERKY